MVHGAPQSTRVGRGYQGSGAICGEKISGQRAMENRYLFQTLGEISKRYAIFVVSPQVRGLSSDPPQYVALQSQPSHSGQDLQPNGYSSYFGLSSMITGRTVCGWDASLLATWHNHVIMNSSNGQSP